MKKRTLTAIIITILVMIFTNKLWLTTKLGSCDFYVLIIISLLTFLLAYRLSNYIAEFKTVQGKSRIEIFFLTLFFTFLFIPMSHINNNNISEQENRTLAKWHPIINKDGSINYEFGKKFNDWFNDRFYLRQILINMNDLFHSSLNADAEFRTEGFLIKKTNFMFRYYEFNKYSENSMEEYCTYLKQFNNFCNQHNIKLYILVVPNKEFVYPVDSKYIHIKSYCNDEKVFEKLNSNNIKVIYPIKELKGAIKSKNIFFKTEHHWTDDGAFIGYTELMKIIKKDYPDIQILQSKDFNFSYNNLIRGDWNRQYGYGSTCKILGYTNLQKYHKQIYTYYTNKNFNKLRINIQDIPYHKNKTFYYPYGSDYRVVQIGTSMNENLTEFIPYTFKNIKYIRLNGVKKLSDEESFKIIKYYEKEILNYRPNIIIFCIAYDNMSKLHNLFTME